MNDKWSLPVHMQVFLCGKCSRCGKYSEKIVYDYGRLPYNELENRMDEVTHPIQEIPCKSCEVMYNPEYLSYRDKLKGVKEIKQTISYGNMPSPEEHEVIMADHSSRYELYAIEGNSFWAMYIQFALDNWRDLVNELLREEIEVGYRELGISTALKTDQQARRDVLNRLKTGEDKSSFWKASNEFFVHDELLNIGAIGWVIDLMAKRYGLRRTKFVIMHFPLAKSHELIRTKAMGALFRKDKGDNDYFMRRIAAMTDELQRAHQKVTDLHFDMERKKHELADAQSKLAEAYATNRAFLDGEHRKVDRNAADVSRIGELKSFVNELMNELRGYRKLELDNLAQNSHQENAVLEEVDDRSDSPLTDLSALVGKTVSIIGGERKSQAANDYPCKIYTDNGDHMHSLINVLKQADFIVVLTKHVSHLAMWEAKAFAFAQEIPIFYLSEINVNRILQTIIADKKLSALFG